MKKFNLEMLRLTSDEVLEKSQMKKITGGASWSCRCTAGVGSWTGNYSNDQEVWQAIGRNCEGGMGHCAQQ